MSNEKLTILSDADAALVLEHGELKLVLPRWASNEDRDIPDPMAFLIACFLRYNEDPKFLEEMEDWCDENVTAEDVPGTERIH